MNRATSILFWFTLTIAVSAALYHTSYRAQELRLQLRSLDNAIEAEQANIHVLKAEWSYLANPAQVEGMARRHLALHPTRPAQIVQLSQLAERLPTQQEVLAGVTVISPPLANVGTTKPEQPVGTNFMPPPAAQRGKAPTEAKVEARAQDSNHVNTRMNFQKTAGGLLPTRARPILLANFGATP